MQPSDKFMRIIFIMFYVFYGTGKSYFFNGVKRVFVFTCFEIFFSCFSPWNSITCGQCTQIFFTVSRFYFIIDNFLNLSFLQKKTKINKKRIKMMTIFSKSLTFQVLWHSRADSYDKRKA